MNDFLTYLSDLPCRLQISEGVALAEQDALVIIGNEDTLCSTKVTSNVPQPQLYEKIAQGLSPSLFKVDSCSSKLLDGDKLISLHVACFTKKASRHNSSVRCDQIASFCKKTLPGLLQKESDMGIIFALAASKDAFPAACAAARSLPLYRRKGKAIPKKAASMSFIFEDGSELSAKEISRIQRAIQSIQMAAALVDMPTCELTTTSYRAFAKTLSSKFNFDYKEIVGESVAAEGMGGLYAVGKCAEEPPAMVILSKKAEKRTEDHVTRVFVGKGIVYDTGGLGLKTKDGMYGMKMDMGGSAGVLGAFVGLAREELEGVDLHCILCLAENAIGASAFRHGDILTMLSGKTVTINNTDAEGRLVLGDGVAYAAKYLNPDQIIDMATLTGAQGPNTGNKVGAVLCNGAEIESAMVQAGKSSGDLVYPIIYTPEYQLPEYDNPIADMKNSANNRSNGLCSCAGLFIEAQLPDEYKGDWCHIDMAAPAHDGEEATGFGVALLMSF